MPAPPGRPKAALRTWGSSEAAPAFQGLFTTDPDTGYRLEPGARASFTLTAAVAPGLRSGTYLGPLVARAVARRFSPVWEELSRNAFLFKSPRVSVPMLRQVVADVENGRLGTRGLLSAAAVALGFNPEDFDSRIA